MENDVVTLGERLQEDPRWQEAMARLDQSLLRLYYQSANSLALTIAYEEPSERTLQALLMSLRSQIVGYYHYLDFVGLSPVLAKYAPEVLSDFKFSTASSFREFEERLVSFEVPVEAWERFWKAVDAEAPMVLRAMDEQDDFRCRPVLSSLVAPLGKSLPQSYPLSPFKWSKPIAAGLAFVLGVADTSTLVVSAGVTATSLVAGLAASVYSAWPSPGIAGTPNQSPAPDS